MLMSRSSRRPGNRRNGDQDNQDLWNVLDAKTYSIAEAARLSGLHPRRTARWLMGYTYEYPVQEGWRQGEQAPVVGRVGTVGTTYASFLDLIDLLFVRNFLEHGLSLQKVRLALNEATALLGTKHFARQTFFTDGRNIYLQLIQLGPEKAGGILQLMTGGQWTIAPIIEELAAKIDFHEATGYARRWFPLGRKRPVVVDPFISFGRPSVINRGVATENIYDFFLGEQGQVDTVSRWMGLESTEVLAAVEFEQKMAA